MSISETMEVFSIVMSRGCEVLECMCLSIRGERVFPLHERVFPLHGRASA